ncbi:hypothetical protein [Rufibacter tibetensis]|uniref:Uncharacterized protein n=1 Tax=Rufibacter tibetensis TaxID=512763 RepID=A0A0P0D139_9BACT|nr:hypothetical protein [Rufibacter tibetensis]ALJ00764.1 hypothetical protein DC20_19465 [Rufibacter tibetensis]
MHRPSINLAQNIKDELKSQLSERLKNGRNLVYYASGTRIREGYSELPYDNVVLVDSNFNEVIEIEDKIVCVGLTATLATALFKEIGAEFEGFVCINEGLSEGGGHYSLNNNWSLSNILPIMKDEYLHIACPGYYGQSKWKRYFNLPQTTTSLDVNDTDFLDPKIFSNYPKECFVWRVTKQPGKPATFRVGDRTVTVQRRNIWEDSHKLDALFVRCSPSEIKNLKSVEKKVQYVKDFSFEQILQYCTSNKIAVIGLCPWLRHDYNGFMDYLKANEGGYPYPKQLCFYHLNANDFQQLYARAEQNSEIHTLAGI